MNFCFIVSDEILKSRWLQSNFYRLVTSYRDHGHKIASINPVDFINLKRELQELDYKRFGFSDSDTVDFTGILDLPIAKSTISEATNILKKIYCGSISYEFSYLQSEFERDWFAAEIEKSSLLALTKDEKLNLAKELLKSQTWDKFLATKFPTVKRYGGEGAESMMAFFIEILEGSAKANVKNIVMGMPHRGKLNVLTGFLQCPPAKIFRKFKGLPEFRSGTKAMCDIASHFGVSTDIKIGNKYIHFNLLNNPSHLEVI